MGGDREACRKDSKVLGRQWGGWGRCPLSLEPQRESSAGSEGSTQVCTQSLRAGLETVGATASTVHRRMEVGGEDHPGGEISGPRMEPP